MKNSSGFLEGRVILIVEDLDSNFRFLEVLLGILNKARVLWAKDGNEAVNMCLQHKEIEVVLMDIQLPVMDGYEATKRILEFRPDLPIIAQTANAMPEEIKRCMEAGCSVYIIKPIRKDELIEAIRSVLKA
jgi:CheY-like chemotaxis protein